MANVEKTAAAKRQKKRAAEEKDDDEEGVDADSEESSPVKLTADLEALMEADDNAMQDDGEGDPELQAKLSQARSELAQPGNRNLDNFIGFFLLNESAKEHRQTKSEAKVHKQFEIQCAVNKSYNKKFDVVEKELKALRDLLVKQSRKEEEASTVGSSASTRSGRTVESEEIDASSFTDGSSLHKARVNAANKKGWWGPKYDLMSGEREILVLGGFASGSPIEYRYKQILEFWRVCQETEPRMRGCDSLCKVFEAISSNVSSKSFDSKYVRCHNQFNSTINVWCDSLRDARWLKSVWRKVSGTNKKIAIDEKNQPVKVWATVDCERHTKVRKKLFATAIDAVTELLKDAGLDVRCIHVQAVQGTVMHKALDAVIGKELLLHPRYSLDIKFNGPNLWSLLQETGKFESEETMVNELRKKLAEASTS